MYSNSDEFTKHFRDTSISTIHAAEREQPVSVKPQLTEIERRQLTVWNATQQNYSQDACVHQLVARIAAAAPEAVAVVM